MRNRKRNIILSLLIIDILLALVLTSVFNFSINKYLDREVRKSLEIESYLYDNEDDVDELLFEESSFAAVAMYVESQYVAQEEDYDNNLLYEKDNYLLRQCKLKQEELKKGEIIVFTIFQDRYYLMQLPVRETDSSYGSEDVILLYINTGPFQRLIDDINMIFGLVVLISAILVCFIGFKAGEYFEDSDRKMKHFFENVSHELKTPIMNIQGYAEGIELGVITDTQDAARVILSESDRMTVMVNEILELSKIESGTIKPELALNDLREIIYECLERLTPIAEKGSIKFNIVGLRSITIYCDNDLIEKVLLNILTNALRYAKEEITIELLEDDAVIKVRIIDDGNALNEEDKSHIFRRFYYGEKGSTGVGLALAKEIMELHGGDIFVEANPRTCFIIEFKKNHKNKSKSTILN